MCMCVHPSGNTFSLDDLAKQLFVGAHILHEGAGGFQNDHRNIELSHVQEMETKEYLKRT